MNINLKRTGTVAGCIFITALSAISFADGERDLTEKTGHRYVSNVSETVIDDLASKGYRMTDIEVVSTGPHRYTASFIKNSGAYATGWHWAANQSKTEMKEYLKAKGTRIIDIETYWVNGKRKYAFTTVENGERNHKDWWWFAGKTWQEMNDFVSLKGGRLIDVDVEKINGKRYFSGVLIKNSGQDHKSWLVFSNKSSKEVKALISAERGELRMRLIDLERLGKDRFAGILQETEGQAWWWYTNRTWDDVKRLQGQFASRIIDIERNVSGNKARFDILLLDNSNDLEKRIGSLIRGNSDGTTGFMLKEVNGPTIGSILPDFRTYPASTIKVLQHYYWSSRVWQTVQPQTDVPIYSNHTQDTHTPGQITQYLPFQSVTQFMMWNSGNTSTNALQDFAGNGNGVLGRENINNFGWNTLGLTDDIKLNHKMAAGDVKNDPSNVFTMRQITKLYEQFGNGVGLNNAQWNWMHDKMLNETGVVNSSFRNGVRNVMLFEGNAIGMTDDEVMDVFFLVTMVWKPGNVATMASSAGWIRLPFKTTNGTVQREFVVGTFDHDFTSQTITNFSRNILPEILRDELAACLETWK